MARIRTIKPEFWQDEDIATLPPATILLAIGLLNHSDDEGYFQAHPSLVRAVVFPFSETSMNIHDMLTELSNIGYLELFEGSDNKKYGLVRNFLKHQRISRPSGSKIRHLRPLTHTSHTPHVQLSTGKEQGKEHVLPKTPPNKSGPYVFEGETIKIKQADYETFTTQYQNLDLDYQLSQLDMELRGKKNWYVEMHSKLNYRNKTPAHHAASGNYEAVL